MKVHKKLVIKIETGEILDSISDNYEGPVALAKGAKVAYGKPGYSVSSQIVGGLQGLPGALNDTIINNPFTDASRAEYQDVVSGIRGNYGARGLANSGIAIKGENTALTDIALKSQAQRAAQLTGLLGTASSSPSFPGGTSPTPRGFMRLK